MIYMAEVKVTSQFHKFYGAPIVKLYYSQHTCRHTVNETKYAYHTRILFLEKYALIFTYFIFFHTRILEPCGELLENQSNAMESL
jgi:hypothetical protein